MASAPPDSAIILPSMVPSATTTAIWPRVPPTPTSKEWTTLASGIPGDNGERERSEQQAEEWIEFEDGDEQDDSDDGAERAEQQKDAVRIDHRLASFLEITARFIGATRSRCEEGSGLRGLR